VIIIDHVRRHRPRWPLARKARRSGARILSQQLVGRGRGGGLAGHPFGDERLAQAVPPGAGRGGDQRQVDDVAWGRPSDP